MIFLSFLIAITIAVGGTAIGFVFYWKITKKWIRYSASIFRGLDFKEMAEAEGVKETEEEKEYMRKYLRKMLIFGAVVAGLFLWLLLSNTDLSYYKIYPLKTLLTNAELYEKAKVGSFIGIFFVFITAAIMYPYKLAIIFIIPGGYRPRFYD